MNQYGMITGITLLEMIPMNISTFIEQARTIVSEGDEDNIVSDIFDNGFYAIYTTVDNYYSDEGEVFDTLASWLYEAVYNNDDTHIQL